MAVAGRAPRRPAGLQITLFQELEPLEERTRRPGCGRAAERHRPAP